MPDLALYEEYVKGLGLGEDQVATACSKWNRTVWFARRHGAAVSTVPTGCSGQVQFQFEGSRLIAVIDLEELQLLSEDMKEHSMQYVCVFSVVKGNRDTEVTLLPLATPTQEAIHKFESMTAETATSSDCSFHVGCILPGDVLVLPPGVLVVEKIVNSHTIGLRSNLHLVTDQSVRRFEVGFKMMSPTFTGDNKIWFRVSSFLIFVLEINCLDSRTLK